MDHSLTSTERICWKIDLHVGLFDPAVTVQHSIQPRLDKGYACVCLWLLEKARCATVPLIYSASRSRLDRLLPSLSHVILLEDILILLEETE